MNKDKPFITVMVLCYNYGHLLRRALDAVAAQDFNDYELLFIDNGSIDNSKEVFEVFCKDHPEVNTRYMHVCPNQGPCHGWNLGIKEARGEYVLFNDADDWMEPNCLSVLANVAKESGADRVTGQYMEVLPDGKVSRVRHLVANSNSKIVTPMLQGSIYRRSIILNNKIELPENVFGPYDFFLTFKFADCEKNKPVFVTTNVYNYLINPNSICRITEKELSSDYTIETVYQKAVKPFIDIATDCVREGMDNDLKDQECYLIVRNSYASVFSLFKSHPYEIADGVFKKTRNELEKIFKNYRCNRFINPIGNGFEFPGSVAVWFMVVGEESFVLKLAFKLINRVFVK